jgi:copper(I)-binding protein
VSRAPQESTRRKRIVPAAVGAAVGVAVALAGCGSGQNTQTDSALPAVNGALGQIGPIAIRDAMIAYPESGGYPAGGSAPLTLMIVNSAWGEDELVDVSSPVAADADLSGTLRLHPRRAIAVGQPGETADPRPPSSVVTTTRTPSSTTGAPPSSASSAPGSESSAPSSPPPSTTSTTSTTSAPPSSVAPGEIDRASIVLIGLNEALSPGKRYPVTFVFRNAGSVTIELPIASPTSARPEPTGAKPHG